MNSNPMRPVNHLFTLSVINIKHLSVCKYPIRIICKIREDNITNKKIMYKSLLCILILFSNILITNAQTLKTYSGKYKYGTATYTYKDNPEGGRIYEGNFIYVGSNGIDKVIGKFKKDKKDGVWTYSTRGFMESMPTLKVTYKNGILNGLYKYTSNSGSISLTIKNGKFVGDVNGKNLSFSFQKDISNYITTLKSLNGQFDENGYCDGKWTLQQDDVIYFYGIYEHGICKKFYREDLTTGDIENVIGDISYMLNKIIENNYNDLECMIERNNAKWEWWNVEKEEEKEKPQALTEQTDEVVYENSENQEVFDIADTMPEFQGGMSELMKYLENNIKYPTIAQKNGTQGRVIVKFVVNQDGSIVDPVVMRSVDPDLDKEAIRLISSMPKWKPGRIDNKNVRVRYTLPVTFKL